VLRQMNNDIVYTLPLSI